MQCKSASSSVSAQSLASKTILYALFWTMLIGSSAHAISCFETNEDGDMVEVTNNDFTYCVLIPEHIEGNKFIESRAFGIGPASDSTNMYDKVFATGTNLYHVLSMCIYERYDFGLISPKFGFKHPEFMLRCFCNTDGCNREKNFFSYIDNLRIDSVASKSNALAHS